MAFRGPSVDRRSFLKLAGVTATVGANAAGCALWPGKRDAGPFNVPYAELASDPSDLASSYDVIVIGSGYGGSIMAARLAKGRRVAMLERGVEWGPGSFPETHSEGIGDLRSRYNPLGLVDVRHYDDLDVVMGCGLGGTSLLNANVIIEPDPDLFDQEPWPEEIRRDRDNGKLKSFYRTATAALGGARYEADRETWAKTAGFHSVEAAVQKRGGRIDPALLAVNFDRYKGEKNEFGAFQLPCTHCGNCTPGCNVSAKNTLNFNYLPLARSEGAEIYTRVEVSSIQKRSGGGYVVHGLVHDDVKRSPTRKQGAGAKRRKDGPQSIEIRAGAVVLSAGSLGSTEILLRSRDSGLKVSKRVGQGFSGNADTLGMAYNTDVQLDSVAFGTRSPKYAAVGPTITTIGDFRSGGSIPIADRFLLEEGSTPSAIADVLRHLLPLVPQDIRAESGGQAAKRAERAIRDHGIGLDPKGALNHSFVMLGMGHDGSGGRLRLDKKGRVEVDWKGVRDEPVFDRIRETMRDVTDALGGIFVMDVYSRWSGRNEVTVHPLGGCGIGSDVATGVTDHLGRVFDAGAGGKAVHEGLFVVDGAMVPGSVGVNPFITISALAERSAAAINAGEASLGSLGS